MNFIINGMKKKTLELFDENGIVVGVYEDRPDKEKKQPELIEVGRI